jgi:hypothetical protein
MKITVQKVFMAIMEVPDGTPLKDIKKMGMELSPDEFNQDDMVFLDDQGNDLEYME